MSAYLIAHVGHTGRHNEHICWWKPDSRGYTICVDKAGVYGEEEAARICDDGTCVAVPPEHAQAVARSHPYFRRSNGTLSPLYDGSNHRPVPNSKEAWTRILDHARPRSRRALKPTPIGVKARAIYLDGIAMQTGETKGGAQ
jgi:hypothetical protein